MRMNTSYANRGMAFEQMLELANKQYERKDIAVINKRPTPVKVLKTEGTNIKKAVYDSKSTVDYYGVYKGRAIYFEAKSTKSHTSFSLANISDHQLEHLAKTELNGALCFFLIEFASKREVYFVPYSFIRMYVLNARLGGRKSIPYDEFEIYAYLVQKSQRASLDYLVFVDRMMGVA
ncbi:recombinase RecU [Brevibacillus laterosporus]|nr:recombinase RecU [Brevibacillus laterosporus]